ncbi:hypothetical protein [Devosia sp. 1635]|uniref:hypothetical protein n=1 Tax=Devosia sp. 1635 TaxID=2726066 RepID=UPI001564DCEB|nr:hypothetical protein [Devosia sp. 1635]
MAKTGLTTEAEISEAVVKILKASKSGEAKLSALKKLIPTVIPLSNDDLAQSDTRPNEPVWEQRLRNIKSHSQNEGNFIAEGYLTAPSRGVLRITPAGLKRP